MSIVKSSFKKKNTLKYIFNTVTISLDILSLYCLSSWLLWLHFPPFRALPNPACASRHTSRTVPSIDLPKRGGFRRVKWWFHRFNRQKMANQPTRINHYQSNIWVWHDLAWFYKLVILCVGANKRVFKDTGMRVNHLSFGPKSSNIWPRPTC